MRMFTGDIETDGLLDTVTRIWCGAFKDHSTGKLVFFGPDQIEDMFKFLDTVDVLIMHNGIGFDWPVMEKCYGYVFKGARVDTLLMSRTQRPDRLLSPACPNRRAGPHSVEAWGWKLGRGKVWHEEWDRYSPEMRRRCEEDVEIQYLILQALLKEGHGEGWKEAHKLTAKLFGILERQERYGWTVDVEHMGRCISILNHWIRRIDLSVGPLLPLVAEPGEVKKQGEYGYVRKPFKKNGELAAGTLQLFGDNGASVCGPYSRVSFRRVDINSNLEIKRFLLSLGWEPVAWNEDAQGNRTSAKMSKDDPFEGMQGSLGKLIARRVQCKQKLSIVEGWLRSVRADGCIPSSVAGLTVTGRARHRNIVNVPRPSSFFGGWLRRIFIARPGWVLVGTDSDANHARMLAGKMGDEEFTLSITQGRKEDGTDMHNLNRRKIGMGTRDQAKIFFYAFLLGAMPKRLSKVLMCSVAEAALARENFLNNMGGLQQVIDDLTKEWRSHAKHKYNPKYNRMELRNGWFRGLDGRPIFCEYEKDILGYSLQSDESIMMAKAYVTFHQWLDEGEYVWGKDYGTVCWYHDEWITECRPEIAKEIGELAAKAIVWAGEFYKIKCPHKGNYQIGHSWKDIH